MESCRADFENTERDFLAAFIHMDTGDTGGSVWETLKWKTQNYFCRVVSG